MINNMKFAISWYKNDEMVANLERCQMMLIGLKDAINLCIDINGIVVQMTDSVKLLGVAIDSTSTSTSMYNQSVENFKLS